jgi:serpin B
MVLTNAIYFNAEWLKKFDPNRTHDGTFTLLDGEEITVPLMRQREDFYIAEGDGYQAVELLYKGNEISMLVILPEAGNFEAFEESLNTELINSILESKQSMDTNLVMPKFTYDSEFSLKETLSGMGMPDAFDYQVADFSGMDGTDLLFIRDVVHKAFVAVDEAGTEAAAATAVVMEEESEPYSIRIDRPFIFLIRDRETGSILFLGRVMNPIG